jgi:hypothetical protein
VIFQCRAPTRPDRHSASGARTKRTRRKSWAKQVIVQLVRDRLDDLPRREAATLATEESRLEIAPAPQLPTGCRERRHQGLPSKAPVSLLEHPHGALPIGRQTNLLATARLSVVFVVGDQDWVTRPDEFACAQDRPKLARWTRASAINARVQPCSRSQLLWQAHVPSRPRIGEDPGDPSALIGHTGRFDQLRPTPIRATHGNLNTLLGNSSIGTKLTMASCFGVGRAGAGRSARRLTKRSTAAVPPSTAARSSSVSGICANMRWR